MKFSILQQDLLPHLQALGRSVGVRSTLPVLDNLLLSAEGKKLKIAATNLEIGVIRYLNVEVETEGALTIPAKTLIEVISGLGQGKIVFESKEDILNLTCLKFKASINGISASEFPPIPVSAKEGVSLPKEAILSSSQILFASALDEGRPVLTAVYTEVKGGALNLVATDGFRLAHRKFELASKEIQFKSLIPRRTFEEILRILSETEVDEVSLAQSSDQNQIVFTLGSSIVSSRLIEGSFPAWEKIVPTQILTRVMVEKEEFLKGVKLAAIFAKESSIIVLSLEKEGLKLNSSAKQLGVQQNEVEANVEGEQMEIAFNSKFLLDAVSNSPAAQLMLEFSGPLSAALIKPVGVEGLEYIIMPVRTN